VSEGNSREERKARALEAPDSPARETSDPGARGGRPLRGFFAGGTPVIREEGLRAGRPRSRVGRFTRAGIRRFQRPGLSFFPGISLAHRKLAARISWGERSEPQRRHLSPATTLASTLRCSPVFHGTSSVLFVGGSEAHPKLCGLVDCRCPNS
jgi:hypothetical protein